MVTGVFIRATGISYEASNSNWEVESLLFSLEGFRGAILLPSLGAACRALYESLAKAIPIA